MKNFEPGTIYKLIEDFWDTKQDDEQPALQEGLYKYVGLTKDPAFSPNPVHEFFCLNDNEGYYLFNSDLETAKFEDCATGTEERSQ